MEDKYFKYRAMSEEMYYKMPSHDDIETKLIRDCLDELYKNSIPSTTLDEMEDNYKKLVEEKGKKEADKLHTYQGYFCPHTIQEQIIEHYLYIYNLEKKWEDYVDVVIRDLKEGPTIDKYIEREGDQPGYRGYEHLPSLKEKIGEDAYNQVMDYIEKIKNHYRFEYRIENLKFSIWNVAPNTSKENTIKWRQENGEPDFNITDEEIEQKYFIDEDDFVYNEEIKEDVE